MSMQSWKEEFYPIEAEEVPEELALDHSIKKWEGLQTANLIKHSVIMEGIKLKNDAPYTNPYDILIISASSCALCMHHHNDFGTQQTCKTCPIRTVSESQNVVFGVNTEPCLAEYLEATKHYNTVPMLQLLQQTKKGLENARTY